MCGIAGIINLSGETVNRVDIEKMTSLVQHRGPDGSGIYCENNIALGHRRLSIIDLSEAGAQPMKYNSKYVIVFNGEIYNYIEIRTELQKKGYVFNTSSDTEVILAAYDFWKYDCVKQFNGMWSFCIYDRTLNTLFCSRDRFGVKPFYYSLDAATFVFGSEIRQLLGIGLPAFANRNVLANYLVLGLEEYNEETFFQNIVRLPPAHNLICNLSDGSVQIEKYYTIQTNPAIAALSLEDSTDLFLNELIRSVNYRLRSDVKVGTCLSGGLDSSMIAALASLSYSENARKQFTAITASSIDKLNDETDYAKMVVEKSKLDWITTTPLQSDFLSSIDEVVRTQEEPFGSPSVFMQYFVMKKAHDAGCPVLLDGQGGDETLLGYQRYYPSYIMSLKGIQKWTGLLQSAKNSGLSSLQLLKNYFYFTNSTVRIKRQENRSSFMNNEFVQRIDHNLVKSMADSYRNIKEMQLLEITTTQLPHLLRYEDKNSMHFSIETRLPFLDYKMVELSISLNDNFKIKDGYSKYILRNASKDKLPDAIAWRKNKIGFEAPTSIWMKEHQFMYDAIYKSKILSSIIKQQPIRSLDTVLLWRLFNVAKWEEVFNVS
ncbi:MAG: asparagine synthase (glutamine-hydrolyzing) [Bacteroidetes bacterium]|nr:asparagine synthase (glutamine-hydrolyzing) [Bacteroidota bacterium]